ncbi:argininosuccinate synthase [Micromonospora sonneratiae]|uniref:Argininosuccinate synthase n=1 Tax=Micromonospora sonneratiae TaxID=1184706 RepID=A0ABW3YJ62_9ACTN
MKRIVLAFSGGLDTSVALVWLRETYQCPVTAFIADVGQNEDLEAIGRRAEQLGADGVHILDLREEFARDYVFPMHRADARYEGQYLLGSPIARPLIAAAQIRVAEEVGADAVAHGCTGKGNCQARFELAYAALRPDIKIIVPWREWDLGGRTDLLAYADKRGIELDFSSGERPYSIDANLLHTCYEGEVLEDPAVAPPAGLRQRVRDIADTPEEPEILRIGFERGDPVTVNDDRLAPAELLYVLGEIGSRHGIGRLDMVENRINGIKTRTVSEAPAGTLLWHAHRAVQTLVLDPEVSALKEELAPRYARYVYNGLWFAPERQMLQAAIDFSQQDVTGEVTLELHRGNVQVLGRTSPNSRYDTSYATFEADNVFDQRDSSGWLRVNMVRFRLGRST